MVMRPYTDGKTIVSTKIGQGRPNAEDSGDVCYVRATSGWARIDEDLGRDGQVKGLHGGRCDSHHGMHSRILNR